jgi:hypothetical protein
VVPSGGPDSSRQGVQYVDSLELAAEILMSDDWPLHDRTCERAAEMLIHALRGEATVDQARAAFENAAKAAGILVR